MKIEIKEPCGEDWSKMKIGLISRHCDSCDKSVFDFTQKSREEIIIHLLSKPNERVCGRMNSSQFDFHHEDIPILIEALKKRPVNSSFLVLTLVCLSLVACTSENGGSTKTKIDVPKAHHQSKPEFSPVSSQLNNDSIENKSKEKKGCEKRESVQFGHDAIVGMYEPEVVYPGGDIVLEVPPPIEVELPELVGPLKFAEKMPEYRGGMEALFTFINQNIHYPDYERENQITGTVYASIIIHKDGTIGNAKILRSVAGAKSFDSEVLRVISYMPNWIPGENNGKKVDVEYNLPFRFTLK